MKIPLKRPSHWIARFFGRRSITRFLRTFVPYMKNDLSTVDYLLARQIIHASAEALMAAKAICETYEECFLPSCEKLIALAKICPEVKPFFEEVAREDFARSKYDRLAPDPSRLPLVRQRVAHLVDVLGEQS